MSRPPRGKQLWRLPSDLGSQLGSQLGTHLGPHLSTAGAQVARVAKATKLDRLKPRVRKRTVALVAMLILIALVIAGWAVLRQTALIRETLEAQLSESFGAKVSIASAQWDGWDTVEATNLVLRVPGWPAPADEVATIRRAVVIFRPTGLLGGTLELVDMEIEGLTLRLMEQEGGAQQFNFLALKPKPGGTGRVSQPQKAMLRDLRLELGYVHDGKVEVITRRTFVGDFEHVPDEPSLYSFRLQQTEEDGGPPKGDPIRMFGTWNEVSYSYEFTLDSLPIGPSTIALLPMQARTWAQRASLTGRIDSARFSGSTNDPLKAAEVQISNVQMRDRDWVRALTWSRMVGDTITPIKGELSARLSQATIAVRGSSLEFDTSDAHLLPGTRGSGAVEIPVDLHMVVDLNPTRLPAFKVDTSESWFDQALNTAPFSLRLRLSSVSAQPLADGSPRPVELPDVAIKALREFGARDWLADVDLSASRARATQDENGAWLAKPMEIRGRLALSDGTIRYRAFPYQLDRVSGVLALEGDHVRVEDLSGRGSGSAVLHLNGEVVLKQPDPGFDIRAVGTQVPVDARLRSSFDGATAKIFTTLFDEGSYESLHEAGLADETQKPGGLVDFDLRVKHVSGDSDNVITTGSVNVHEATVVIHEFPLPLKVKGSLTLEDERVTLDGNGMQASTQSGGTGVISGRVDLPRVGDERRTETHLVFDFHHQTFTPLLLAAIPASFDGAEPPPPGWPGKVFSSTAQILQALGVQGSMDISGSVQTQPDGDDRVETVVRLHDGSVNPRPNLPRTLRNFGLSWPGQLALTDVTGTIHLNPEMVEVKEATAKRDGGTATARAKFAPNGQFGALRVELKDFPFKRDLIGIADDANLADAYRAWDALQPTGTFDGTVTWRRDEGSVTTYAEAFPRTLTLVGSQKLEPQCGQFVYRDGTVEVRDLDLRGASAEGEPLHVEASGMLVGPTVDFHATASGVRIATPLVRGALAAGGRQGIQDAVDEWHLDGMLDADLWLGGAAPSDWRLSLSPSWLSAAREDAPVTLKIHSGTITASPEGARFEALRASVPTGWLELNGLISPAAPSGTRTDLTLSMNLARWSDDVEGLLPSSAQDALRGIEFDTTGLVQSDGLRIEYEDVDGQTPQARVTGELLMAGGSFKAGTPFAEADGTLTFDLATRQGNASGAIDLRFARMDVVGREATDVTAALRFDAEHDQVTLEDLCGHMYGGRVVGRAVSEMGSSYSATIVFANVGFASFAEATDTPEQRSSARVARAGHEGPGRMRGRFELHGTVGQPELQRGVGRVVVNDARMMEFPLGLSILQLSQLMLPLNASMERADAEFEIKGDVLSFKKFEIASSTLRLEGSGSLSLSDGDLALRFRNRGTLPLVSDLFGAFVGDQMFMIDVGGTLQAPQPRMVPIPILSPEPSLPASGRTRTTPEAQAQANPGAAGRV